MSEDAVQQVFLKLWENKVDFTKVKQPKSYLFSAVKNQVINEARKSAIVSTLENEDVSESFNVEDYLDGKDLEQKLKMVIEALPPKRQYIFRLSREDHKSHKEIAEFLDITPKTVENQIGKALKFIKSKIYSTDSQ